MYGNATYFNGSWIAGLYFLTEASEEPEVTEALAALDIWIERVFKMINSASQRAFVRQKNSQKF